MSTQCDNIIDYRPPERPQKRVTELQNKKMQNALFLY